MGVDNTAPVARIRIDPWSISLPAGGSQQLTAQLWDADGNALEGREVSWSSNRRHVTVDATGKVTALDSGSVATITAVSEGRQAYAAVTITSSGGDSGPNPVASVVVSPATASVLVGQTTQLTATLRDAENNQLTGRTITWSSSNPAVATVNGSGLVSGVGQGGATITATSEGQSGSAAITVNVAQPAPVASVTVTPATDSLEVGQTTQLTAVTRDANGNVLTGRAIAWSSSNAAVATVNSSGLVSAVGQGGATITASSEGQSGSAAITVTVPPPTVAVVTVTPSNADLETGESVQLTATARSSNGTIISGQTFSWLSSNPAVATVSSSGLVQAVSAGSATITATTSGVSGNASITVTAPPPPPPPPPADGNALFFSDWRTQIGNAESAISDGGKWNWMSADASSNGSIVDAPAGFSTHKVLRVRSNGTRSGWLAPTVTTLGQIPIGSTRNYRWEHAFHEPALSDAGQHPIQDGGSASSSNWYMSTVNGGGNLTSGQWALEWGFWGNSDWNRAEFVLGAREGQWTPLRKGQVYRIEIQIVRVSSTQFRFHTWIHDAAGNLLYDDDDFRSRDGSTSLASNPLQTFNNPANATNFVIGLNGIGGSVPWPIHSSDQAAFAVVQGLSEGQQIGPYGSVQGEMRR
jgi:uncharacterized protein YjdB